ncbi:MAG TPA: response regulator [Xanthobacteraceae bacterium]|nr:response regulator [Xanthobacteraceae bacterium]
MEPDVTPTAPIHVLFVEDEFLIAEWVAQSLAAQGFDVETVTNAADALEHLAAMPVDVLFTDINLPGGMDGAALAWRAREMWPQLPVVYASARATLLKQDARVPGSIVVPKPYEPALVGRLLAAATKAATAAIPA